MSIRPVTATQVEAQPSDSEISGTASPEQARPVTVSQSRSALIPYARPDDRAPVGDDSRVERFLRERFAALSPNESYEIKGEGNLDLELSFAFKGRIRVERREDGTFDVTLEGQGEGGVGAPVVGNARLGLGANARFRVDTAGEAADLCDALIKSTVVSASGASETVAVLRAMGVKDDVVDATERVISYFSKMAELRGDVVGRGQLGGPLLQLRGVGAGIKGEVTANAEARLSAAVDLIKGELRLGAQFGLGVSGVLDVPWLTKYGGQGRFVANATFVFKLDEASKAALKDGRLTLEEVAALAQREMKPDKLIVRVEGDVNAGFRVMPAGADAKMKVVSERTLDVAALQGDGALMNVLRSFADETWSVEVDAGLGPDYGFKVGPVGVGFGATRRRRWNLLEKATLPEAISRALDESAKLDSTALEAHRATANLR